MTERHTVGRDVASRVADRLDNGDVLGYAHRDFCGMGLELQRDVYVHGPIQDWWVSQDKPNDSKLHCGGASFRTREAFVDWLAAQSDHSLSGHDLEHEFYRDNQRLTLARLQAFANGGDGRAPDVPR